ncbi:MAG: TonB-dependent receptor, partial [Muribaculaceae bacterium]|nr:TonB-dependent receptor [Muribaculaceae bacterium]
GGRAYAVELDADVSGAGKIYWNEENSLSQPFYLLPGASISLRADKWSVQLWGKNLSSTKYYTFYFLSMGNEFLQKGRPVQVGVTFRFQL